MVTEGQRDARVVTIRSALSRGELLLAYDEAASAVEAYPGDTTLKYYAVLALARAGATDRAEEELERFGLDRSVDPGIAAPLVEDMAALRARLAKDRALADPISRRRAGARRAAKLYESIFVRLQRPYACINAATMWLLAGDARRSQDLATAALELSQVSVPESPTDAYWRAATEAEAALLLGDEATASEALARAASEAGPDMAARATTRKQLELVCAAQGIDLSVLAALSTPSVVHYCGHMITPEGGNGPFAAENEGVVAARIDEYVRGKQPGVAFGSLACGADILFAEASLDAGAELHVVLPFNTADFKQVSVAPGGNGWLQRFDNCLAAATSVSFAREEEYGGDDALFDYAARITMGRALIRARFLSTEVEQAAVWDGRPATSLGGTASNVEAWHEQRGRRSHVIAPSGEVTTAEGVARSPGTDPRFRAMLFADVKGFSRLRDAELTRFLDGVLQPLAQTLERFDNDILYRNSWGDGLYVVLRDVVSAASCALALQDTMRSIDVGVVGLPETLGLRIGGHAGPVLEAEDPIRHEPNFYGQCVTRTARIEPRTPEGSVYVTDAFAALLALQTGTQVSCQYVGHIPTANDYGTFPMYRLSRSR